ncbi:hypothetical protein KFL_009710010 [Klebsormidium nitens]|uniref:Mediator of RNA polymerase II transcription subunit 21 n=1 Tax=Klebsormidium nitens TaxID=105231 RepID=A0A1Y1IS08_KLENI|nr:hypothetical protein KFL_009710010 [Klebsormidium nitens]|eukprot:GAQ92299.1 hypothetical protein KFL_009710010 [Klebsormidium nitens]
MDIVSQLQDQVDHIASLLFNHVGTLQRDAPPASLDKRAAKKEGAPHPEPLAAAVVQAARVLDELIAACPATAQGEEAQLARIEELQNESDRLGEEIREELEGAEADQEIVDAMFLSLADSCLPMAKKPNGATETRVVDASKQIDTHMSMDEDFPP